MPFADLQEFVRYLEQKGQLKRIRIRPVYTHALVFLGPAYLDTVRLSSE